MSKKNQQQLWEERWRAIEQAGGRYQYVQQQLKEKGFLVARKPIDNMKTAERERYKKSLKDEAAAQRQLQKDTWLAYKANHIVYLGQGIYWSDDNSEDKWDLPDAGKRLLENQLPILKTPKDLANALNLSIPQLKGLCFHQEVAKKIPYVHFTIAKRDGTPRQIWAPIACLKYAQRWILQNLLNPLTIHGSAHGFIQGKSIVSNADVHTNSQLIIKMDIKDFFPSINWRRIKGVFRHAGFNEQIATLLAMLCCESPRNISKQGNDTLYIALDEPCLPQGAPTSPALTNIVCVNLDRRLTGLADSLNLRYSRYADDLTFSVPAEQIHNLQDERQLITGLLGSVAKILTEEGFSIHHKKTKIIRQSGCQQVTGLVVNGESDSRVPRHIKRMLRAAVHNLENGKALKQGETLNTLKGYAAYIAMTQPALGKHYMDRLNHFAKTVSHEAKTNTR